MKDFDSGTETVFARTISAELRARMAAQRVSGKSLAAKVGMSQNYLATRLRDEKPFTLDDIDVLAFELSQDGAQDFIAEAVERNYDAVDHQRHVSKKEFELAAMAGQKDNMPDTTTGEESQVSPYEDD